MLPCHLQANYVAPSWAFCVLLCHLLQALQFVEMVLASCCVHVSAPSSSCLRRPSRMNDPPFAVLHLRRDRVLYILHVAPGLWRGCLDTKCLRSLVPDAVISFRDRSVFSVFVLGLFPFFIESWLGSAGCHLMPMIHEHPSGAWVSGVNDLVQLLYCGFDQADPLVHLVS